MIKLLKSRKVRFFIALFSMLLLFDMIEGSYAKYVSSASAGGNIAIAKWSFKVNDQDVLSHSDFSSTIVPVIDANSNIKEGFIAPTSTGYFDVVIDYDGIGVSFDETISVSNPDGSPVSDLVLSGYTLNGGQLVEIETGDEIELTHDLATTTTTRDSFRFYIEWIDGDGESMNNSDDTAASHEEETALKVNLNFVQKAN